MQTQGAKILCGQTDGLMLHELGSTRSRGRGLERPPSEPRAAPTLLTPASRTVRENISAVLSHPVCETLYGGRETPTPRASMKPCSDGKATCSGPVGFSGTPPHPHLQDGGLSSGGIAASDVAAVDGRPPAPGRQAPHDSRVTTWMEGTKDTTKRVLGAEQEALCLQSAATPPVTPQAGDHGPASGLSSASQRSCLQTSHGGCLGAKAQCSPHDTRAGLANTSLGLWARPQPSLGGSWIRKGHMTPSFLCWAQTTGKLCHCLSVVPDTSTHTHTHVHTLTHAHTPTHTNAHTRSGNSIAR